MFGYEDDLKWEICNLRLVVDACEAFVKAFEAQGQHVVYPTKEHCAMADALKIYQRQRDLKFTHIKHDDQYAKGLLNELANLRR
jgi:hypothetical protein